jgi:hypothetical protein
MWWAQYAIEINTISSNKYLEMRMRATVEMLTETEVGLLEKCPSLLPDINENCNMAVSS